MQLDVALTWTQLRQWDLSRTVVVVADVLRATTVMVTALSNGAKAIIPQDDDEESRRLVASLREQGIPALLSGEKGGFKRKGYDLGNSPDEFSPEMVSGKTIVHLTTNGTRALVSASSAQSVAVVAFGNLSAVARWLSKVDSSVDRIVGVVSGREENYCLEDAVCIGGMLKKLTECSDREYALSDAARTAMNLYDIYHEQLLTMVRLCFHGVFMQSIGLGDDLPACVKVDFTDLIPLMKEGRIVAIR